MAWMCFVNVCFVVGIDGVPKKCREWTPTVLFFGFQ